MLEALREISHEVTSGTDIGSPFYPYTRLDISPRFTVDEASGLGHADFLECSLLRDPDRATLGPTFWRVSSDGKATLIDAYKEDDPGWCEICNVRPGTLLSPNITVQLLAGVVRHARAMAERFDSATGVSFRCEGRGLSGRRADDPRVVWHSRPLARDDSRVSIGNWAVPLLSGDWPTVVSDLAAPAMRAFMTRHIVTPDWVSTHPGKAAFRGRLISTSLM